MLTYRLRARRRCSLRTLGPTARLGAFRARRARTEASRHRLRTACRNRSCFQPARQRMVGTVAVAGSDCAKDRQALIALWECWTTQRARAHRASGRRRCCCCCHALKYSGVARAVDQTSGNLPALGGREPERGKVQSADQVHLLPRCAQQSPAEPGLAATTTVEPLSAGRCRERLASARTGRRLCAAWSSSRPGRCQVCPGREATPSWRPRPPPAGMPTGNR